MSTGDDSGAERARAEHEHRDGPQRDPFQVIAYLLSGILLYGGAGLLLDRWLGTSFLVPVGLVVGAGMAVWLVHLHFGPPRP
jgi:F0F1-type ATP synthase assembly protein I